MRHFDAATTILLAMLVVTARSLPLNTQNIEEDSHMSSSESDESMQQEKSIENEETSNEGKLLEDFSESIESNAELALHQYLEEQRYLNHLLREIDEISNEEVDELENKIVKRSPDIPDPDRYQVNQSTDRSEAPRVYSTHDEYLEWKSQQPRYRRNSDDDENDDENESFDEDYHNIQPVVENSLEEYAQGCEVMEEKSDENNETTYDVYRRKREVSQEEVASESESEEKESPLPAVDESEESDSEDSKTSVQYDKPESSIEASSEQAADLQDIASTYDNEDESIEGRHQSVADESFEA